jgi:hypothetical protein
MFKIGLVESCEKKVCLNVLHIELVIMYKLFCHYVYMIRHKVLYNMLLWGVHCLCVGTCHAVLLMALCCESIMLLQHMLLWRGIMCVVLRMYVRVGARTVSKLFYRR